MAGGVPTSVLLSDKSAAALRLDLYIMPRCWHARSARRSWDWFRSSSHGQDMMKMMKSYEIMEEKLTRELPLILGAATK